MRPDRDLRASLVDGRIVRSSKRIDDAEAKRGELRRAEGISLDIALFVVRRRNYEAQAGDSSAYCRTIPTRVVLDHVSHFARRQDDSLVTDRLVVNLHCEVGRRRPLEVRSKPL